MVFEKHDYVSEFYRRPVEMHEKIFLREQKVVTETQCDLG